MISKLVKILTYLDQFGAISLLTFLNNGSKYKTIYGGLLSLLIYSLGSVYFLYLMYMWGSNNIQPIVTTQKTFNPDYRDFQLISTPFVFSLVVGGESKYITSLQDKGDITDYKIYSSNIEKPLKHNNAGYNCSQQISPLFDFPNPICMNLEDGNQTLISLNSKVRSQDSYIQFVIKYCDPISHTQNKSKCMSLNDQAKLFGEQGSQWKLSLMTQDIDLKTGNIINIPRDYYIIATKYQECQAVFIDLKLTIATYFIDTGIIFSNIQKIQLVHSIDQNQLVTTGVTQGNINNTLITAIQFCLDKQEILILISYPKLGYVLAQSASILQALLLFGLIMNIFNDSQMKVKIEEALLKVYFPQIKLFEFKYNWWGKLITILFNGQLVEQKNFQEIKKFRETQGKQVLQKVNYVNILHELSRVQIQMQQTLSRQQLVKLQDQGYKMNFDLLDPTKIVNEPPDIELLDYDDFQLLHKYQTSIDTKQDDNNAMIVIKENSQFIDQQRHIINSPKVSLPKHKLIQNNRHVN